MKKHLLTLLLVLGLLSTHGMWIHSAAQTVQPSNPGLRVAVEQQLQAVQSAPVPLGQEGLPNAYKVSEGLYRGGQPSEEGYRWLARNGIKIVVNLRTQNPDEQLLRNLGITSIHIPINPFLFRDRHAVTFLKVLADAHNQPVYVHCKYGSDRTGTMVALYRMAMQHWSRLDAMTEMQNPKFDFHSVFFNLLEYVKAVDVTSLAREAGLPPGPAPVLSNTMLAGGLSYPRKLLHP
ncbi:MAG: dual specificity protein phosphatase family protein [Elusimicrobiaceae bacterium]|nr:dual specificity protein phosphatase family protein [Elusimicrobiaceae bacterium]